MTHWQSPRFHAYFVTGQSYPSILADILSATFGCVGFSWITSPACTELEMKMMDWVASMIGLPDDFKFGASKGKGGGVIQGSASESILVALLTAKAQILNKYAVKVSCNNKAAHTNDNGFKAESKADIALEQLDLVSGGDAKPIADRIVAYCSDLAHCSCERATMLAGVKLHSVPSNKNCQMTGKELRVALEADLRNNLLPFFVIATLGTTDVCSFDELQSIGEVCREFGVWLHVDAAYAGSALVCPEFRYFLAGADFVDSFEFNPHKWLLVNHDCSAFFIRDSSLLVNAFNVDPLILKHNAQGKVPDYRHWQIALSRRFRSLKIWFVLRMYGVSGLQAYIRQHVALAKYFESLLLDSKARRHNSVQQNGHSSSVELFEVTHPTTLGLVCFRMKVSIVLENEQVHSNIGKA